MLEDSARRGSAEAAKLLLARRRREEPEESAAEGYPSPVCWEAMTEEEKDAIDLLTALEAGDIERSQVLGELDREDWDLGTRAEEASRRLGRAQGNGRAHRGAAVRRCIVCEAPLDGRRRQARYCSAGCRLEASRLRAILAGAEVEGYSTLPAYLARHRNRANGQQPASMDASTKVGPRV